MQTPEVRFFTNEAINKKGINAIYRKKDNIIAFNEQWIVAANHIEVQVTCFHEARQLFQYEIVNDKYRGDIAIDEETIKLWKKELSDYKTILKDKTNEEYLIQDIEVDAITFAHKMMLEHFKVKTIIPEDIREEVNNKRRFIS